MNAAIPTKIERIRELKGISQDYVATQLDISQRAYSKIENGSTRLRWDHIEDIARILDMDPMEMIQVDESLVFNHCHQSGKFVDIHNNFPKELKEQYENRIAHLETEVLFLRKQLER